MNSLSVSDKEYIKEAAERIMTKYPFNRAQLDQFVKEDIEKSGLFKVKRKAIFGGSDKSDLAQGDNTMEIFKSFGHFAQEVIQAELSGPSANLQNYQNKAVGEMEEGDLGLGG